MGTEEWEKTLDEITWRMYGQTFASICEGSSSAIIKPIIKELLNKYVISTKHD